MTVVVEVLIALVGVWMAVTFATWIWLGRRNRVTPSSRTRAPISWLLSPARPAIAHRRLRRAVHAARGASGRRPGRGPDGELEACVAALERHAVAVDDHLVLAAGCAPAVRRSLVRGLSKEVSEVERLAARVVSMAITRDGDGPPLESALTARWIDDRLRALETAHEELAALEELWIRPPAQVRAERPPRDA